jgi:RNA polymerase sigma-70 factor (ECF subfamily)
MFQTAEGTPRPLEYYRDYLRLLARLQLSRGLDRFVDPSDIAQQTILKAHENLRGFRGKTEAEFQAWLRAIMAQELALLARKNARGRARIQTLGAEIEQWSIRLESLLPSEQSSPSEQVMKAERLSKLSTVILTLPEDQRTAVELRYLGGLSVPAVAREMKRTTISVTGLLYRGTKALRQKMDEAG